MLALRTPDELMDSELFRKRHFAGDGFRCTSQGDRLVWAHVQRLLRLVGFTCRQAFLLSLSKVDFYLGLRCSRRKEARMLEIHDLD